MATEEKVTSLSGLERFLNNIKKYLKLKNPSSLKLTLIQKNLQSIGSISTSYDGGSQISLDLTPSNLGCLGAEDTAIRAEKADSATYALNDSQGQAIDNTYIKKIEINGREVNIIKGDGTAQTPPLELPVIDIVATQDTNGLLSSFDKKKLDSIDWNANNYELPAASYNSLGGVKTTSEVTNVENLFPCPIVDGVPYYGLTDYKLTSESIAGADGIIKGENTVDGSKYDSFSISYNDAVDPDIEIAKLVMNKQGLTIYGDTATTGVIATTLASNDYAENRNVCSSDINNVKPGLVFTEYEEENDTIRLTNDRLEPIPMVCSDTYGLVVGQRKENSIPIAVSGRVLVYPYEDRDSYKLGDTVCSAPNGKVSKMTREEIKEYPDRILGYVSCIPDYDKWDNGADIDGRIWIRLK